MVRVHRTNSLEHAGKKGMKWGYNDGSRNGRRTAAELLSVKKKAEEMAKNSSAYDVGKDFTGDYDEANNMLKYLGITLDLQSDEENVVKTMQIYKNMANSKDKYKSQYDWLRAFSNMLGEAGYDMDAVKNMLDTNKEELNKMQTGTGTGNREKSNADWKENDMKKLDTTSTKKSKADTTKSSDKKTTTTSSTKNNDDKKDNKKKKSSSTTKTTTSRKYSYDYKPDVYWNPSLAKAKHSENQNGEELYHWGILGQKWGLRRYQNSDGSLTDEGRIHYGYKARRSNSVVEKLSGETAKDKKKNIRTSKAENFDVEKHNSDIKIAKNTVSTAINTSRTVNKTIDKVEEAKYRKKLEKMTNEELEAEIAKAMPDYEARVLRQQLEQKYNKVIGNENSTKIGRETVMNTIEMVGGVSLASIAVLDLVVRLKNLK